MFPIIEQTYKKPYEIIKIDKNTGKINTPTLLLMNRSGHIIGRISRYDNWQISLVGNGIDEITFDVHKYTDGITCPVWNDLEDLKIVEVDGFGRYEISVNYTDNTETVKSVHGFSLETELAQICLYEFHVNDEEAADMVVNDNITGNYDDNGNYVPTVFYNKNDTPHSLLHRVLAYAPHWSIGYVTPYIALGEDVQPEESSKFQRTYTVDGDSIYDFLTGTVAEESNVIFVFDTIHRKINCYSLCDCIDQKNGELMTYKEKPVTGIGEDTSVFVSKTKLANEITISSNKDNVKNCFRIEGGDDVITDMVRAVNMSGSNYIYQFAGFQYDDMSEALKKKIQDYQAMMSDEKTQAEYYGNGDIIDNFLKGSLTLQITSELDAVYVLSICENNKVKTDRVRTDNRGYNWISCYIGTLFDGTKELRIGSISYEWKSVSEAVDNMGIYTRLCSAYESLAYLESSMMPGTDRITEPGDAKEQYDKVIKALQESPVAVSSLDSYSGDYFIGVTNNIKAYAQVFLDSRFDLEIIDGTTTYACTKNAATGRTETGIWTGKIRIRQHTDETNVFSSVKPIDIKVNDDEQAFAKQKIHKALSQDSMADIDFDMEGIWGDKILTDKEKTQKMLNYFNRYSLNRRQSFYQGYDSCLSILMNLGQTTVSKTAPNVRNNLYDAYIQRFDIVTSLKGKRQEQVDEINSQISVLLEEQKKFQKDHDLRNFLNNDDLYREFCSYRREDTYTNNNYISDGLSTTGCLEKAKELVEAATKEAKKACMLQRTVSTSLNNLFALPEFDKLYDKFALYNYIRVKTDDEILKLRLIGIDFSGDSAENIEVTFSEQIESVDGRIDDLKNIIKQASSMATSYPSTALQAKQGSDAKNEITDMYTNGLNAAKTMLTNNDNNEVTVTESGIICRRMDDEGIYGDKQIRITGNIMAFTDDSWESVRMAIGETTFYNPFTKQYEKKYGIYADAIVGKLIVGNNMFIGNENNNVQITGDGIEISNGVIKSKDYNETEGTGSIIDLRDGSFSFAGGGLTYRNKDDEYNSEKQLKVKGDIEATSIFAHGGYSLSDKGLKTEVLSANNNNNPATGDRTWNLYLKLNYDTGICFFEGQHIYIDEKTGNEMHEDSIDIKSCDINLYSLRSINLKGNVYSQTGQIITSDRDLKDNITPLSDKYIKFFFLLQPVSFTFIDGESGRTHIGFISQDVEDAMTKAGLTDLDFAGFCKRIKTVEITDKDGHKWYEMEKDENGNPVYVYSLRYEEFIALNTFMIQKQNKQIQNLQKENQDIKERLLHLEERLDKLK